MISSEDPSVSRFKLYFVFFWRFEVSSIIHETTCKDRESNCYDMKFFFLNLDVKY